MILSDLKSFLGSLEKKPNKGLSQNFLIDTNIVKKMVQLADIKPGDPVLEIGPGAGALTKVLLESGAKVYAVEKDRILAQELSRLQNGNLKIYEEDILNFPLTLLPRGVKLVANLPYHITAPILEKIFAFDLFSSLTVMVQKEVAERIQSKKGKTFGAFSLFVQFYSRCVDSFSVPPQCFYPSPKIDSTVVRLNLVTPPKVNPAAFFQLVRTGFQKRRKMLSSSLPFPKDLIQRVLTAIGSRPDARPEALTFENWVALFEKIQNPVF